MNLFKKIIFLFKRPPVILVVGKKRSLAKEAILKVLEPGVLLFESDLSEPKKFKKLKFFLKKSKLPILVVTNMGEIPSDEIKGLAKFLPAYGFLVLNFDDETVRQIKEEVSFHILTYGFQERAILRATDINLSSEGTNFKINYQGNIVPFWLKNVFEKEEIYNILAAVAMGIILNINLVEISQALKK